MPSIFAELENELSDAIDDTFGEGFTFLPMIQATVNSRREPDPDRPSVPVQAVIDERNPGSSSFARLGATSGGTAASGGAPQFTATNPMLFLEERRMAAAGRPRRYDRFRRDDTGHVYEVTDVHQDGQGRLKLGLALVKREA